MQFVRWMGPLLEALRALGGKAAPRECSDWIADKLKLPSELIEAKLKSGSERFHNQVQWARQYLAWEGLIDSPQRGIWTLPSDGFERLCKRALHEYGFERVVVLGKSHDGGIDGLGILRINPFVSIKVMIQCKRLRGAVSRAQVGDFRNATMGRADKGIFITTGYFSADAKKEADRDGVLPIELVDGERLVELFETKQLGLKPKQVFEIDHSFFDQFR